MTSPTSRLRNTVSDPMMLLSVELMELKSTQLLTNCPSRAKSTSESVPPPPLVDD